jgi:hypothetical protein
MSAYKLNINVRNTPKQEVFVTFQCNVLSLPIVDGDTISFESQVMEFNGKTRTEIPVKCLTSVYDQRISNKVNKLLKGNKVEITGNLIKNHNDKIVVSIIYLVYVNVNNFSSLDKKDSFKLPWLNSSDISKKKSDDQDESNDLPDFIVNSKKAEIVNVEDDESEDRVIETAEGNAY